MFGRLCRYQFIGGENLNGNAISELGDIALRLGDKVRANRFYKLALRRLQAESPSACPECGRPETYWPHIIMGKIMALEIQIAGQQEMKTVPTAAGEITLLQH